MWNLRAQHSKVSRMSSSKQHCLSYLKLEFCAAAKAPDSIGTLPFEASESESDPGSALNQGMVLDDHRKMAVLVALRCSGYGSLSHNISPALHKHAASLELRVARCLPVPEFKVRRRAP